MKKNFVSVEMLVDTAYQGPRRAGEIISVPEDFAKRWAKNGIAKFAKGAPISDDKPEDISESISVDSETSITDYSQLSPKDLFNLCKEQGIDVEAKKSKEYYIEKLSN